MRTVAIVQARMGSSRLPNKVMMELCGHPALWHIYDRIRRSKRVDEFVIATSSMPENDGIEAFAMKNGISVFRGSEDNVLERVYLAAKKANADAVVRLTGDNVLVCAEIIDAGAVYFEQEGSLDYLYYREGLPLGLAVEIMKYDALECAYLEAADAECLEHVTPYLYRNPQRFCCHRHVGLGEDCSKIRWTMDTPEDYELIEKIYAELYKEGEYFGYLDALQEYKKNAAWPALNQSVLQKKISYQGEARENNKGTVNEKG